MPDRCQFAASNGLPQEQAALLEALVDAIGSGPNPVDSLRASEPLLTKLQRLQPQQPLLRPPEQSRHDALLKLQNWTQENFPQSQAGVLWEFSNKANSVCAKRHLDTGSVFISIPKAMMLQAAPGILQMNFFFTQIPSAALTLQLLIETRKPSSTCNALFISSLPYVGIDDLDSAWLWSFEDIQALLTGTSAFEKAIRTRLSTIQHYVYIMGRIQLPKVLFGLSWVEWLWASAIVLSRQNESPDGTPFLVPCWDMCNDKHSGAESYFIQAEDRLVAECKHPIEPGSEIFINYGQRSAAQLLVLQGYLHRNPITPAKVQADLKTLGASSDGIEKLRAMLFDKRSLSSLPMTIAPDGSISSPLRWAARIACLSRDDAAFLLRNPTAESVSEANEERALVSLQAFMSLLLREIVAAQKRLDSLPTSHYFNRVALAKSLVHTEMEIFKVGLERLGKKAE